MVFSIKVYIEIRTEIGNLREPFLVKLWLERMEKPCAAIGKMLWTNILEVEIPRRLGLLFAILLFCLKYSQVQLAVVLSKTDSYSYVLYFSFSNFGLDYQQEVYESGHLVL